MSHDNSKSYEGIFTKLDMHIKPVRAQIAIDFGDSSLTIAHVGAEKHVNMA